MSYFPLALFSAIGLLALDAPAQKAKERPELGPRSFFPGEYTKEYFVNVDGLQDTDLWDVVQRSVVSGVLFGKFRAEFGFRIEDIHSVRFAGKVIRDPRDASDPGREVTVTVLQGSKRLCLPSTAAVPGFRYLVRTEAQLAGFDLVNEAPDQLNSNWQVPRTYVLPRPGCLVIGDQELIHSVLQGKRRGGVISARLMALTAQRRPMAYMASTLR